VVGASQAGSLTSPVMSYAIRASAVLAGVAPICLEGDPYDRCLCLEDGGGWSRLPGFFPTMFDLLLLFVAGFLAGSMNALAGGGSFVSLPALISVGVPSVIANASSTFALFPGGVASSWVYREGVREVCGVGVKPIVVVTVTGGVTGSILLLLTPTTTFDVMLPWLLLVATSMLILGPKLGIRLQRVRRSQTAVVLSIQLLLGIYGGYFGGAVGLMMLAAWSLLGGGDIKSLNPTRMVMVTAANAVAVIVFVLAGAIAWQQCLPMIAGAFAGGWSGAHLGRRLPAPIVRAITVVVAVLTTVIFFARAYL
jgi:uncharacterized protein